MTLNANFVAFSYQPLLTFRTDFSTKSQFCALSLMRDEDNKETKKRKSLPTPNRELWLHIVYLKIPSLRFQKTFDHTQKNEIGKSLKLVATFSESFRTTHTKLKGRLYFTGNFYLVFY